MRWAGRVLRLVAALMLADGAFAKLYGHAERVAIFEQLGSEPVGRIAAGVIELVLAAGLIFPQGWWFAAMGLVVVMVGAIGSHLTVLGVEVGGDDGKLFLQAVVLLVAGVMLTGLGAARRGAISRAESRRR